MSAMVADRCRFAECARPVRWATNVLDRRIPLDVDTVSAGTQGAMVLIGERAFSLPDAVAHLMRRGFAESEAEAHRMAMEDYLWHLPHPAVCRRAL